MTHKTNHSPKSGDAVDFLGDKVAEGALDVCGVAVTSVCGVCDGGAAVILLADDGGECGVVERGVEDAWTEERSCVRF